MHDGVANASGDEADGLAILRQKRARQSEAETSGFSADRGIHGRAMAGKAQGSPDQTRDGRRQAAAQLASGLGIARLGAGLQFLKFSDAIVHEGVSFS
jgi:hypothetical protein